MSNIASRIALVGYGEVGRIFAAALAAKQPGNVAAYDAKVDDVAWAAKARAQAAADGVRLANDIASAVHDADLVISAVTAASSGDASAAIATVIRKGAFVLDVNSAAPSSKAQCAAKVAKAAGRYVEAAVLNAVPPQGLRTPMLLGGPDAQAILPLLESLGFDAQVGSDRLGVVSALKLCRSVVMKGMEALLVESMLAARHYGVEDEVLASLQGSYPGIEWDKQATYAWSRVVEHGRRRAEEMREAAVNVRDAGIEPRMASATAEVQATIATLREAGRFDDAGPKADWRALADRVKE